MSSFLGISATRGYRNYDSVQPPTNPPTEPLPGLPDGYGNESGPHLFANAGQSNMQGKFGDVNNPNYPFTSTNGYWWDGETQQLISTLRGTAAIGTDSTDGCMDNYFAEKYFELSGRKAVMIPGAVGGTCLTNIAGEENWGNGTNGTLRAQWKGLIDSALSHYGKTRPHAGLWAQGEGDATYMYLNPETYTREIVKAALQDLVDWWFSNYPSTPFIISEVGIRDNDPDVTAYLDIMREIQQEVIAENPLVYSGFKQAKDYGSDFPPGTEGIDRSDVGGMGDRIHYNYLGYTLMGKGLATFCHNLNQGTPNYTLNGYTYYTSAA